MLDKKKIGLRFGNIFSYFSRKTDSDISCKVSLWETMCMKCFLIFFFFRKLSSIVSSAESAQIW